jgi:hypothetical protein
MSCRRVALSMQLARPSRAEELSAGVGVDYAT